MLVTLIPGLPDHLVQVLLILQDVNAAMSPILLTFIVLLVNNRRLMGRRVNGPIRNVIAWATVAVIAVLVVLLLVSSIFHITL